jgi:hypothetical protein
MKRTIVILLACAVAAAGLILLNCFDGKRAHIDRVSKVDIEMSQLLFAVKTYCGINPDGQKNAAEISKVLRGGKPGETVIIEWRTDGIDASGNFLDPWRTPYEITGTVPGRVTIRSAGRDRAFGTRDDKEYNSEIR